jgi:tetratricopeptide (TPR) repeat protein
MAGMEDQMTGMDRMITRLGLMLVLLGTLASCAVQEHKPPARTAPDEPLQAGPAGDRPADQAVDADVATQALSKEMMFDILLAEIAGQRGELNISAPHYLQAAEEANDPRVAERAVQIAMFAKEFDIAKRAARRWVELESDNLEAHKLLTALALRTGDMDEVIEQMGYLLSITDNPKDGYRLATAIMARNTDKQAALTAMEKLVARDPGSPYAQMALSRTAVLADKMDQALEAVDTALRLQPDLPDAVILKAQILAGMERKEEAVQLLQQATERHPDNLDIRFAYARILLDTKDLKGAREQFGQVVRLDPENADALYSLGLLELETEQYKAGKKHLRKLLKLEERVQGAYYYLGFASVKQGRDAEALDWYKKVESGDFWSQSQLHIAEIMVRQGRVDEMQDHLRVLRQKNPETAVAFYLIEGQVLSDAGYLEKAYDVYGRALESDPDNEDLLYARALTAQEMGQLELAEKDMRHILKNDPDNARTLNALGYTLADQTDRYEEALGYISKALELKPDDPAIIDSMGWVQFRLGNLEKARTFLQQAWDMTQDSEIGAHFGEVLWAQGEHEAARRVWDEAKASNPENPVLLEVLKRINP